MENKYQNGKIYCLCSNNYYYIGSTIQSLEERVKGHLRDFKYKNNNNVTSHKILLLSKDFECNLIENFSCNSKIELEKREGFYIKEYKKKYGDNCVNKNIAGRTSQEYTNDPLIKNKKIKYDEIYRQENKEQISKSKKNHRAKNIVKILNQEQIYRNNNREKIRKNDKKRYEWVKSFGGDFRYNNNLISISIDLFH